MEILFGPLLNIYLFVKTFFVVLYHSGQVELILSFSLSDFLPAYDSNFIVLYLSCLSLLPQEPNSWSLSKNSLFSHSGFLPNRLMAHEDSLLLYLYFPSWEAFSLCPSGLAPKGPSQPVSQTVQSLPPGSPSQQFCWHKESQAILGTYSQPTIENLFYLAEGLDLMIPRGPFQTPIILWFCVFHICLCAEKRFPEIAVFWSVAFGCSSVKLCLHWHSMHSFIQLNFQCNQKV